MTTSLPGSPACSKVSFYAVTSQQAPTHRGEPGGSRQLAQLTSVMSGDSWRASPSAELMLGEKSSGQTSLKTPSINARLQTRQSP